MSPPVLAPSADGCWKDASGRRARPLATNSGEGVSGTVIWLSRTASLQNPRPAGQGTCQTPCTKWATPERSLARRQMGCMLRWPCNPAGHDTATCIRAILRALGSQRAPVRDNLGGRRGGRHVLEGFVGVIAAPKGTIIQGQPRQ